MTKAGEAIGERVRSATAATAAVAGHAERIVEDAAAATVAAVGQAKTVLGDVGETAQQAWSQAGAVAEDVVDAGRRATRSVSRQIHENPLMAIMVGAASATSPAGGFTGGGGRPSKNDGKGRNAESAFAIRFRSLFERVLKRLKGDELAHIDKRPKEAGITLLRMIAYHERRARRAEERNLEESLRYHEASGEDAEELLALYEKRWPEEAAVGRSEYAEAVAAEAGNYVPIQGAAQLIADAVKAVV